MERGEAYVSRLAKSTTSDMDLSALQLQTLKEGSRNERDRFETRLY